MGRPDTSDAPHEEAIRALIYRYSELLDAGDVDGFAKLFEGAELSIEGSDTSVRGSAAVRELMTSSMRFYDGVPGTRHVNTNTIVTLAADAASAEARTTFTVFQALPDFPLQPIVVGRYLDRLRRDDGGWRFWQRRIAMDLLGDVSRHLKAL
jgi:3-phenylpropionate/cinnamic acid dioxygenase small subunit